MGCAQQVNAEFGFTKRGGEGGTRLVQHLVTLVQHKVPHAAQLQGAFLTKLHIQTSESEPIPKPLISATKRYLSGCQGPGMTAAKLGT